MIHLVSVELHDFKSLVDRLSLEASLSQSLSGSHYACPLGHSNGSKASRGAVGNSCVKAAANFDRMISRP
jgi:hypothetical protein